MLRHVEGQDGAEQQAGGQAGAAAAARSPPVFIINCHLSAGPEARRRLRQVHDTLEALRKLVAKATGGGGDGGGKGGKAGGKAGKGGGGKAGKGKGGDSDGGAAAAAAPAPPPALVMCGDFNSQGSSGVRELLVAGEVLPAFREAGDPTEAAQAGMEITSKAKKQSFGAFADASEVAYSSEDAPPRPPTIIAAELMSLMLNDSGEGPSGALSKAVDGMFDSLSADGQTLSEAEEAAWLTKINRATTRGSEMRAAKAAREARGEGARLRREDFHQVYTTELMQGKFWGVEHDLRVVSGVGLAAPSALPFTATFDYLYYSTASLRLAGMQPPLAADKYEQLLKPGGDILPNEWFPSDHLPVAAALEFVSA